MNNDTDAETANANAVDSDGSVSWEDFFGTSTDLVPQLLGMFDELARRGYNDHVLPTSCNIPAVLQKRLSLVPHRNSVLNQFCNNSELSKLQRDDTMSNQLDSVKDRDISNVNAYENNEKTNCDDEKSYSDCRLTPIRYNRRRNSARPLSGSSVASSTSSSGCSNQGNACTINPYLASVESLADTCASSQGSGDSGVVTVSESNCRIGNDSNSQRRNSADEDSPFHRPRYCDPHRNPVERVLLEIVDTEAIYVEHLRQVIEGYLIFWRNDPTTFVQQMQLSALFSNIEDIFEFNREFLKEIEKCVLDPVCIANTFIKHNSGFKVYTEYCTNYPRTVSVLTDLMGQEETANAFRERQAALGHALPLGSFLLKPVQRILKYHLLLENLSKEYGADCGTKEHEAKGRNAIEAALAAMTGIAKHINAMKRRHEHAVRVQEIQSLLYGWPGPDLTTSGELVAEGRFRMRGAKAPRHAFLFDRMLLLTKKKEDGLLVYKAHIMCSNLMLIESIPGEPFSFHVIPFDNPRLQYTLQARNLEQKREWTLQIKRVILENYNAVIPSHARQLVLQLGQTQQEDEVLIDKGSGKKQHSAPPEYLEKRKQERERRRSETGIRQKFKKGGRKSDATNEDSPASSRKSQNEDSNNDSREQGLRSSDGRTSKVKERFTGWRRKSEPGFQSYISLNQSDIEQKEEIVEPQESPTTTDEYDKITGNYLSSEIPDKPTKTQTVEEIVGHILMQNEEFQKLLEKQHINSIINVRKQRFTKYVNVESSDSDSENLNYSDKSKTKRVQRSFIRTNNTLNSLNQSNLQLVYDNLNNKTIVETPKKHHRHEEKKLFNKQPIITESKVIKTALSIRENSNGIDLINDNNEFGNYDNLENLWENYHENYNSPIKPSVWLNKLCEGLPTSRQKCGSLPRSFQMNIKTNENIKSRFLQRDGKPINDRPFTIASDKPAEINLEDMERYTTNYQNESRISKFPLTLSSTSTFFSSLDDTRSYNDCTTIHPDHKIYGNVGNSILKNVLSKTGINFLRNTMSTETLECNEEIERMKYFRKLRRKGKLKNTRESSSDVEEFVRCNSKCNIDSMLCYKQGSSDLGARIAQSDYADPMVLFSERRLKIKSEENIESETDSFYEKSFETIENFVDVDDTFRDSAIFSDVEDVGISVLKKCPPALPLKRRIEFPPNSRNFNGKPVVAEKPDYLKGRTSLFHKQFQCNRMKSECGVENVSRHDCDSRDDPTGIALKKQLDCDRTESQSGMEKASRDDCNESKVSTGIIKQRFYSSSVKPYSEVGNVFGDDCDERDVSIGSVFKKHLDRNETMSCKYVSTEIVTKKQFHCNQIDSESAINISRDNSDDRNLSTGIIFKKQFDSNEIKSDRNASTVCKKQFQCNRVNSERTTCDDCDERDVSAGQSQAGWVKKIVGQLQGEL